MSNLNELAVIVCSCDKYKTVWDPFFKLFEKYFDPAPQDVSLFVEKNLVDKETSARWCEKYGGVRIINSSEKKWSKRIKDGLLTVDKGYVLFMLDDFFLQDYVKTDVVEKLIGWMKVNDSISSIRLYPFWESFTNDWPRYKDDFFVIDRNYEERVNAQAAIWRKDRLIELLNDNETAWQFEILASNRSRKDPYLYLGYYQPLALKGIIPYSFAPADGYGITSGKWLWNNKLLFDANEIDCNMLELGVMSEKEWTFHYKSKIYRTYRRIVKFLKIILLKLRNREKISVKEIVASSIGQTRFTLLDDAEYRKYSNMDKLNMQYELRKD